SQIPSLEEIEKATAAALLPHFISCVNHFKVFDSLTIIEPVDPIVRVSFIEDTTKVNLQYQLTVLQENSFEVNEFEVEIPFDFKSTHTAVEEYLRRQEEDPNYFLVGDLSSLTQNEATLQFTQFGEEGEGVLIDLVYSEEKPLIYSFGLTFDWELGEEIDIEIEEPTLTIKQIPDWQINSPGIHTLQIEVEGEDLFFDISPRNGPTIDQNGILTFDTTGYENDEYLYYIEVTDIIDQRQVAPILVNMKMLGQNHLKIIPIGKIKMNIGEELKYQVTTNMQGVTFSSSSPLIVLDEDSGEFNILADEGNIGTHSVRIDARTQTDQTWERFSVEIK
ncbi:MAG: hypothetical protein QF460_03230, partial [Candidatus Nanoarchaeia archaeon]|nr:hypothetical protein [Candidatus Nanoarchaeia archaeon]